MFEGYSRAPARGRTTLLRYDTLLAFAAIYLIWGSTFFAIRAAVETIPPLLMMSLRCAGAGVLLFALGTLRTTPRGAPRESITRRHWRSAFVAGALLFLVSHGSLAWAELRVPSGEAALLSATTPLWLTILDWRWGSGRRPTWRGAAGLALGFAGVACLVAPEWRTSPARDITASAAIVGGALAWAAGSLYNRHAPLPSDVRLATALPLLAGSVWLAAGSLVSGEFGNLAIARITPASAAALAYLIVFGSVVALTAYVWLLRVVPASTIGTHAFVNPIVAVGLGALLGAEQIRLSTIAAAITIAGGVMLALLDRSVPPGGAPHADTDSEHQENPASLANRANLANPLDRPDRDGRRGVSRPGVARPDVARFVERRDGAAGGVAAPSGAQLPDNSAATQYLGTDRAHRVLEIRRAAADNRRETGVVSLQRE
jgi:drug/metabolite transporter (DMT)-like permease